MRAVQYSQYGDPSVLELADVPQPHAGPGQIRVAVKTAAVNPVDWKIRSGASAGFHNLTLPVIPGLDVAGVVDEVGPEVTGVAVGDEVFGLTAVMGGAFAEFAVLGPWAKKPSGMDWAEAAGIGSAAETALRGLTMLAVAEGETLLITGAAGGVGSAAVQLAINLGATVIGTAGPDNLDYLRSLGASALAYGPELPARVKALAGPVDRGLDVAGKSALPDLIAITGSADRVVTLADGTAAEHGVRFSTGSEGRFFQALPLAAELFEQGKFRLPVALEVPLADAAEAHRVSERGHVRGKIVVRVAD